MAAFSRAILTMFASAAVTSAGPTVTCEAGDPGKCECEGSPIGPHTWAPPSYMYSTATSFWDLSEKMYGKDTPLANFKAKAAIVVNVASA
mmetsp:Transcript_90272/g.156444  ORF Transcript_90272/g.156444 Transcript_90272/m.156444 type:complete len:90 (-) Transcript_90272:741-1010(-)